MAMELRHLRYFIAVAEEGHITRAERLGMQQPPLSRQIRELERELDVQLFRRIARGVELTDAGRAFLDGARATFANLELSSETARRTARGEKGAIFLGHPGAAAFYPLVPRIIREFRAAFPLVTVKTIAEGFPDDLVERMRNDQIYCLPPDPGCHPEGNCRRTVAGRRAGCGVTQRTCVRSAQRR